MSTNHQSDIPVREGYFQLVNQDGVWYISGPNLTSCVVTKFNQIQGDIFDIYYRPEDNDNGDGIKIMRCHIMGDITDE